MIRCPVCDELIDHSSLIPFRDTFINVDMDTYACPMCSDCLHHILIIAHRDNESAGKLRKWFDKVMQGRVDKSVRHCERRQWNKTKIKATS